MADQRRPTTYGKLEAGERLLTWETYDRVAAAFGWPRSRGEVTQLDLEPDLRAIGALLHAPIGSERLNELHAPSLAAYRFVGRVEP